jgi:hypothetical protein
MNNTDYIKYINNIHPNIKYSHEKKRILISLRNVDDDFFNQKLYGKLFYFIQTNLIPKNIFEFQYIKDIELDYYFNCLLNYIFEIYKGTKHQHTCWVLNCENSIDYTYDSKNIVFEKLKKKYSNIYNIEGWIKIHGIHPQDFNRNIFRKIFNKFKRLFFKKDRIINLVEKIRKNGWDKTKASQKLGNNEISNGILGYSKITKKFMIFHGKHRLVAAKFLIQKSELSENLKINFPIIEYEEENFRQAKLISKCICKDDYS